MSERASPPKPSKATRIKVVICLIEVYWAKYNENASLVASGGQSSPVIIWDMKTGGILKQLKTKSEVTYCVEWSKDGKYLITTEMDGTLTVFDAKNFNLLASVPGSVVSESRAYGCDLDFVNMPERIFVATQNRHIQDFNFHENNLTLTKEYFAHFDAVKSLTLEGKRQMLLSTGADGSVRLWDAKKGLKPLGNLVGH